MKITPDFEGRNDGYDDNTVRYYEKIDEDGYFYEVYVLIDGEKSRIIITENGVSVDFWKGGGVHTNLDPSRLFPGKKSIGWPGIHRIIKILEAISLEGKLYTEEELEKDYQRWLSENPDASLDQRN